MFPFQFFNPLSSTRQPSSCGQSGSGLERAWACSRFSPALLVPLLRLPGPPAQRAPPLSPGPAPPHLPPSPRCPAPALLPLLRKWKKSCCCCFSRSGSRRSRGRPSGPPRGERLAPRPQRGGVQSSSSSWPPRTRSQGVTALPALFFSFPLLFFSSLLLLLLRLSMPLPRRGSAGV